MERITRIHNLAAVAGGCVDQKRSENHVSLRRPPAWFPRSFSTSSSSSSLAVAYSPAALSTMAAAPATSSSFSLVFIPPTAPAGILSITQPQQTATSFFKIASGEAITFGWNTTYVIATPTHLTVSAVCDNGNTYPVGPTDGVIPGTATEVVWDIYSYQANNPNKPLAQATYTLNIWDDRGPGSARRAGYLQPNSALQFALYTPQSYTAISDGALFFCLFERKGCC